VYKRSVGPRVSLELLEKAPARLLPRLLVAVDGSDGSGRAVSFAIALARRQGSELEFCSVVDHAAAIAECCSMDGAGALILPLAQELDEAAASIVAEARARANGAGLVATGYVLDGKPVEAIVRWETLHQFDAVVMGTRGKRGLERMVLGSTADGVLRRSDVPAFIVPPGASEAAPAFDRILVAVNDSDPSDAAVDFALQFAGGGKSSLIFCSVGETGGQIGDAAWRTSDAASILESHETAGALLAAPMERAAANSVGAERAVAAGDPAEEILRTARSRGADLIVVGTHGRRGVHRWLIGSVAEAVVRDSPVPVAVVRVWKS
jgi:nucleotide-binding universal stress UspA family protein